jgi:hypothetical protein
MLVISSHHKVQIQFNRNGGKVISKDRSTATKAIILVRLSKRCSTVQAVELNGSTVAGKVFFVRRSARTTRVIRPTVLRPYIIRVADTSAKFLAIKKTNF